MERKKETTSWHYLFIAGYIGAIAILEGSIPPFLANPRQEEGLSFKI